MLERGYSPVRQQRSGCPDGRHLGSGSQPQYALPMTDPLPVPAPAPVLQSCTLSNLNARSLQNCWFQEIFRSLDRGFNGSQPQYAHWKRPVDAGGHDSHVPFIRPKERYFSGCDMLPGWSGQVVDLLMVL